MASTSPKWRKIADEIAMQIAEGVYPPGTQLPSVQTLVAEGVGATATVHRAYQALEAEGLVSTTQGSGTKVQPPDEARNMLTGVARLDRLRRTGNPFAPGEKYTNSIADLRSCADAEAATLLGIDLYDEIVYKCRTFVRGEKPTALGINIIHVRILGAVPEAAGTARTEKFRHELYQERTGKTLTPGPQQVNARWAAPDELEEFGIEVPTETPIAVLVLRTVFSDEEGPLEIWYDVLRPGAWHSTS